MKKLFKSILVGGLSIAAASALFVGVGSTKEAVEVNAAVPENMRINVLVSNQYWKEASASTRLNFMTDTDTVVQDVLCQPDADIGETVTISSTEYVLQTGFVDRTKTGTWADFKFLRYSPDGTTSWNWALYGGTRAKVESGERNTFAIVRDGESNKVDEWWTMYWKITKYTNDTDNDYTNLDASKVKKSAQFAAAASESSEITDPTVTPTGMQFVGWYTDPSLEPQYAWDLSISGDAPLYAKYAANTYTITKEVYYDDAYQSSTEENVEEGSSYNLVNPNNVAGYHFKGWYYRDNEQWGDKVPATIVNVTSPITICARYESAAKIGKDSYIYYVTDVTSGQQTPNYIYSYNKTLGEDSEKQFGAWPGTAITTAGTDVHGVLAFQGGPEYGQTRLIYKIPYCTEFTDDQIILVYNNGKDAGGSQTASMLLVSRSAYWWSDDSQYHNDEAGVALDYILNFESKRNAVVASGDIKSTSICGINEEDATDLVNDYNAIDATTRAAYIDNTYTYTYRMGGYYSDSDNVSFRSMLEELAALWELNLNATSNVERIVSAAGGNATLTSNTLVIILITSAVVITLGGIFLLRRKEN